MKSEGYGAGYVYDHDTEDGLLRPVLFPGRHGRAKASTRRPIAAQRPLARKTFGLCGGSRLNWQIDRRGVLISRRRWPRRAGPIATNRPPHCRQRAMSCGWSTSAPPRATSATNDLEAIATTSERNNQRPRADRAAAVRRRAVPRRCWKVRAGACSPGWRRSSPIRATSRCASSAKRTSPRPASPTGRSVASREPKPCTRPPAVWRTFILGLAGRLLEPADTPLTPARRRYLQHIFDPARVFTDCSLDVPYIYG